MTFVAKTDADPALLTASVRSAMHSLDPGQPITDIQPMTDVIAASVSQPRFSMVLLIVFAAIALILAGVGIYGVTSYSVTERTHEVGIRIALGAERSDVIRMVVRQGMLYAAAGAGIGLLASVALTRMMSSFLFEVSDRDPLIFLTVSLFLGLIALLANYIPARRAVRVNPITALRYQ